MTSRWREPLIIADASPLIGLAEIHRWGLLHQLAQEVWIPTAVWREVVEGRATQREVPALQAALAHCVREPDAPNMRLFASRPTKAKRQPWLWRHSVPMRCC